MRFGCTPEEEPEKKQHAYLPNRKLTIKIILENIVAIERLHFHLCGLEASGVRLETGRSFPNTCLGMSSSNCRCTCSAASGKYDEAILQTEDLKLEGFGGEIIRFTVSAMADFRIVAMIVLFRAISIF